MHTLTVTPALGTTAAGVPRLPADAVPAALRTGAGFAAFFGTLWLAQGLLPVGGPLAAAAGLVPGSAIALYLRGTRRTVPGRGAARTVDSHAYRAQRYLTIATITQLAVSVPGAVAVQILVGVDLVLPFVILTVGAYLLALAPVVGRPHLLVAGTVLTLLPLLTTGLLDGTNRTVATGLVGGTVFLAKGFADLVLSRRH